MAKAKRLTKGNALLLKYLWEQLGGVSKVAEMAGTTPQLIVQWRNRGEVPPRRCGEIAEKLSVPIWGLNYFHFWMTFRDEMPSWEKCVKSYDFTPEQQQHIFRGTPPVKG